MTFIVDIVTGASQGIGRAIAESIAFHRGLELAGGALQKNQYSLVMVGRNVERGTRAADAIRGAVGGGALDVSFEACDLSDYSDVARLKDRILQRQGGDGNVCDTRIGILVNDAAECPRKQELVRRAQVSETGERIMVDVDRQFATNVLGYHFMMKIFSEHFSSHTDLLSDGAPRPTHVVNVASNWAGNLDPDDLHFKRRPYDNDTAYRQSKQADRMLTKVWADDLGDVAVVNSCHPGDPCTTLSKALGYNLWSSAPSRNMVDAESSIPFLCGFGKSDVAVSGQWFDGRGDRPSRCQFAAMTKDARRLFDICESFAV